MDGINTCFLTLNRNCNMRCKWCYAKDTEYDMAEYMTDELLMNLIQFICDCKIKKIIFIGGEPTLHNSLHKAINMATSLGLKTAIVTNGVLLSNKGYLTRLMNSGIQSISLSLKSYNRNGYIEDTLTDSYKNVIEAINNLIESDVKFNISWIMTTANIKYTPYVVKYISNLTKKKISLAFEHDFSGDWNKRTDMINKFYQIVDDLLKIKAEFSLFNSLPFCIWDEDVLEKLISKKVLSSICHVKRYSIFHKRSYHL